MKYFTIIILFFFVFSYIDEPCDAGSFGKGVCVEKSSCKLFNKQEGYAYEYVGGAPKWPCPNDPPDVICCVKHLTRLSNGEKEEGRCLNSKHCYSSIDYSGAECPGSENVKVCIEIEKPKGRAYVVNDLVKYIGGNLYIKGYPGGYGDNKGILKYDQYIFATDTNENIVKFYKGYVSEMYLYSVNSEVNYKVNTDRLNFR